MRKLRRLLIVFVILPILLVASIPGARGQAAKLALVGATIITGTGAPAIRDGVIVIDGARIVAVGRRSEISIPPSDLTGDFCTR